MVGVSPWVQDLGQLSQDAHSFHSLISFKVKRTCREPPVPSPLLSLCQAFLQGAACVELALLLHREASCLFLLSSLNHDVGPPLSVILCLDRSACGADTS